LAVGRRGAGDVARPAGRRGPVRGSGARGGGWAGQRRRARCDGVATEIAGGIRRPDPVAIAGRRGKPGVVICGARHGGDLGKARTPAPLATLHQVPGDSDIVGGGGPRQVDLATARRRRGQVRWGRRRGGVWRRRWARRVPALPPHETKVLGKRLNPDIAGGIGPVSRARELEDTIPEYIQGVPSGGQPPLISGDDGGSEGESE